MKESAPDLKYSVKTAKMSPSSADADVVPEGGDEEKANNFESGKSTVESESNKNKPKPSSLSKVGQRGSAVSLSSSPLSVDSSGKPRELPLAVTPRSSFSKPRWKEIVEDCRQKSMLLMVTESGKRISWKKADPAKIGQRSGSIGLELYFTYVRNAVWVWLCWTILSLPLLYFCVYPSSSDEEVGVFGLGIFTLASFGDDVELGEERTVANPFENSAIKVKDMTAVLGLLGASGAFFYWIYVLYFRHVTMGQREEQMDRNSITPSDYTVMVDFVPRRLVDDHRSYALLLKEHVENQLDAARESRRKRRQFVPAVPGEVCEVSLVRDFKGKLMQFQSDQALKNNLFDARNEMDEKRTAKLEKEVQKVLEKRAKQKGSNIDDIDRDVLRAYVTLQTAYDKELLLDWYRLGRYGMTRFFQCKKLRFEQHALRVAEAPEPTNILWENQDMGKKEGLARSCVTILLSILVMVVSIALVLVSKGSQEELQAQKEGETCDDDVLLDGQIITAPLANDYLAENPGETLTDCQCGALGTSALVQNEQLRNGCEDYLEGVVTGLIIAVSASCIIVMINLVLKLILVALTKWERPLTVSLLEAGVATKVFLAQFTNTALIILVLNMEQVQFSFFRGKYDDFTQGWYITVGAAVCTTLAVNVMSPHGVAVVSAWLNNCRKRCCVSCCANNQREVMQIFEPVEFELAPRCGALLNTTFCTFLYCSGCPALVPFALLNFTLVYLADKYILLGHSKRPPAFDAKVMRATIGWVPIGIFLHSLVSIWMLGNQDTFPSNELLDMDATLGDDAKTYYEVLGVVATFIERAFSGAGIGYFALFLLCVIYFCVLLLEVILGNTFGVVLKFLATMCCSAKVDASRGFAQDNMPWLQAKKDLVAAAITASYQIEDNPMYADMLKKDIKFDDHDHRGSTISEYNESGVSLQIKTPAGIKVSAGPGQHMKVKIPGGVDSPARKVDVPREEEEHDDDDDEEEEEEEEEEDYEDDDAEEVDY